MTWNASTARASLPVVDHDDPGANLAYAGTVTYRNHITVMNYATGVTEPEIEAVQPTSPAITDEALVFGYKVSLWPFCGLRGVNKTSHETLWDHGSMPNAVESPPVLNPDTGIMFASDAGHRLFAIEPLTGAWVWNASVAHVNPYANDDWGVSSAVLLGNELLFVTWKDTVLAINQVNGSIVWRYTTPPEAAAEESTGGHNVICTAVGLDEMQGIVIVPTCTSKTVFALDINTGDLRWTQSNFTTLRGSFSIAPLVDASGTRFAFLATATTDTMTGDVAAVSLATGEVVWRAVTDSMASIDTPLMQDHEYLYTMDSDTVVRKLDKVSGTMVAQCQIGDAAMFGQGMTRVPTHENSRQTLIAAVDGIYAFSLP